MEYLSVREAAEKFDMSPRQIQKLCETGRFRDAKKLSGVWVIPNDAKNPSDLRRAERSNGDALSLFDACETLKISLATGKNWVRLKKLTPSSYDGKSPVFSRSYIDGVKGEIETGVRNALKSRRNKKFVSGTCMYENYVSDGCKGLAAVSKTFDALKKIGDVDMKLLSAAVADAAVQMLSQRFDGEKTDLAAFFAREETKFYDRLVWDLIGDDENVAEYIQKYPALFDADYAYEDGEDVLGLLYISALPLSARKAAGSYYTPASIVRKAVSAVDIKDGAKVLDPCCGTGNFLLRLDGVPVENIYGNDVDPMCVMIARTNMALRYGVANLGVLYSNFTASNYLMSHLGCDYDCIVGNPPWGFNFDENATSVLRKNYATAQGKRIESYDAFVEKALRDVKMGGTVCFVLPEAILNVASHEAARRLICDRAAVAGIEYIGNVFDGVQCPAVIMRLTRTDAPFDGAGMRVVAKDRTFEIRRGRKITPERFSFKMTDDEYEVAQKIKNTKRAEYLRDNASFALGIVTGGNDDCLSNTKTDNNEPVLRGSDIFMFSYREPKEYIRYEPESFQQVASEEYYRAKEKLFYRFICDRLVFAYDDTGALSLNSCNILIPRMENKSCKYVMAVLNSSAARFYFKKTFDSVKVLRSHLEQIPIPSATKEEQTAIERLVDEIRVTGDKDVRLLYEKLDDMISSLYLLDEDERKIIKASFANGNDFLAHN